MGDMGLGSVIRACDREYDMGLGGVQGVRLCKDCK